MITPSNPYKRCPSVLYIWVHPWWSQLEKHGVSREEQWGGHSPAELGIMPFFSKIIQISHESWGRPKLRCVEVLFIVAPSQDSIAQEARITTIVFASHLSMDIGKFGLLASAVSWCLPQFSYKPICPCFSPHHLQWHRSFNLVAEIITSWQ